MALWDKIKSKDSMSLDTNAEEFMIEAVTTKPLYYFYLLEIKQRLSKKSIEDFEGILAISEGETRNVVQLLNEL